MLQKSDIAAARSLSYFFRDTYLGSVEKKSFSL
jgi:hypothetical protein